MKITSISLTTNKSMHLSTAAMRFVKGASSQDNGGLMGVNAEAKKAQHED